MLPDGTVVLLVVLHDERCAILRNEQTVLVARGDADGIDGAVQQFMTMTQISDVLDPHTGDDHAGTAEGADSRANTAGDATGGIGSMSNVASASSPSPQGATPRTSA